MNIYMSGSLVRTRAVFTDVTGATADPTTVVLKYRKDTGATTTVTYPSAPIIKESAGVYHADLDTTGWAGPALQLWQTQWQGTGAVTAIGADPWQVQPPEL